MKYALIGLFIAINGCVTSGPVPEFLAETEISNEEPIAVVVAFDWGCNAITLNDEEQFTNFYRRFVRAIQRGTSVAATPSGGAVLNCKDAKGFLIVWQDIVLEQSGDIDPDERCD